MSSIDRIQKLIALAGSTDEHEARSAAYLACKMIREGGYRVVEPAPAAPSDFPAWAWTASRAPAARRPPRRPAADTRPRRNVACEIGVAKRSGRCAVCGEGFDEGSDVAFPTVAADEHLGTVHADCRSRWSVPLDP
ncbi:MAG TPA: DUF2786 domain-containing protein [Polyangiaceae bacterium]|nr:DUF2786 domain-containing protein [Polyangiaceae bacterium]